MDRKREKLIHTYNLNILNIVQKTTTWKEDIRTSCIHKEASMKCIDEHCVKKINNNKIKVYLTNSTQRREQEYAYALISIHYRISLSTLCMH